MSQVFDATTYLTWSPEQVMREYHGELKQELIVRCMEWYTNSEVEAKINAGRPGASKIKSANFYAEMRRNIDHIALHDGKLPSEYRLEFDKRRVANFEARFGSEHISVKHMQASVRAREALSFPDLGDSPSLKQLEAARPDNGTKTQKARETRKYWYCFLTATEKYSMEQMCAVYDMAKSTMVGYIRRAKLIVTRLREIEALENKGQTVPQTYILAPLLRRNRQIYEGTGTPPPSLNVVLKVNQNKQPNGTCEGKSSSPASPPTPAPTIPPRTTLLSARMKTTLTRLRADLDTYPDLLPPLATLASRFGAPIECLGATISERRAFASCETDDTLAAYLLWCADKGDEVVKEHGTRRLTLALSHIISLWRDEVLVAEDAGDEALKETFLQVVMRRLEDLDGVESEVEELERGEDEAAWEFQVT